MSDRREIRYTYEDPNAFFEQDKKVTEEDTGEDTWPSAQSLPPICFPPPLTAGAIEKLKGLGGVIIQELEDE
ncbi:hypothetical protein BDV27DRAFT_162733 [Aspergillus caelatus]|uniref:Uncharacterized protein n=1 Tax=Aspergillus caelatus TaxID=61420 RepID=A0A5N6ZQT0_9EURO|nr:uncharacterized protein BDV27DRAFT_162733 [Aspergillus caelatus]KAE8359326.1 hypothetical protein BDV27DRAFT_162733 [Aspergillus caelatus]